MQITLLTGQAHQKHTEGGDFRQATYRAVRQGLKKAETVLLEPYYSFRLEIPAENVGRAMTDIQRMQGTFQGPETQGELSVITGSAPVAKMRDYQSQVVSYTRGRGHLTCTLKGYEPARIRSRSQRRSDMIPREILRILQVLYSVPMEQASWFPGMR